MTTTMRAWAVADTGRAGLDPVERAVPDPGPQELLVRVHVCGVCRTDLHLALHELAPRRRGTVPGHQVVGQVQAVGPQVDDFSAGDRVGVAWLRSTCGRCRWCRRGSENLCTGSTYTGWDADGGYAGYVTVPAPFAYAVPDSIEDAVVAPLLCAGIIGYRALKRAQLPPGGRLGIYGFGASAHITAQIAIAQGAQVHVMTRDEPARQLALELGAASASGAADPPPVELDAAILFAPAGDLVPAALSALGAAGTLAVAGIHLSDIPLLDYQRHLFRERTLTSVTANTRQDGVELLTLADRLGIRPQVTRYSFAEASQALTDLQAGAFAGAAVIAVDEHQG
jgi:propanol-preferring alcohol dehydrogenase